MAFGRGSHANSDYGAPVQNSSKMYRLAILAIHWLHWISSVIVMSIAAYFISKYTHNTHIVYWVSIAAIDTLLYLPALVLPATASYKGYLAPFSWIFSYLWLTAFIFAAQDYNYGSCALHSPIGLNNCSLKKTLEAFAFLAFFTNLVGHALETYLWHRSSGSAIRHESNKYASTPVAGTAPTGPNAPIGTTAV